MLTTTKKYSFRISDCYTLLSVAHFRATTSKTSRGLREIRFSNYRAKKFRQDSNPEQLASREGERENAGLQEAKYLLHPVISIYVLIISPIYYTVVHTTYTLYISVDG